MGWRSVSRTTASFACIRSAHNGREMPITAAAKGDRQAECETAFRLGLHPSDGAEPGQGSTHALIVNYHQHTQSSLLRPGHRSLYFFFSLVFLPALTVHSPAGWTHPGLRHSQRPEGSKIRRESFARQAFPLLLTASRLTFFKMSPCASRRSCPSPLSFSGACRTTRCLAKDAMSLWHPLLHRRNIAGGEYGAWLEVCTLSMRELWSRGRGLHHAVWPWWWGVVAARWHKQQCQAH